MSALTPAARRHVAFINAGHLIDHMFLLIFPTAVLGMGQDFGRPYGELLALSLGSFIAFGAGSLPAGWLADRWSRRNMMAVFFIGIGITTALTGLATQAWHLAVGLTLIGVFAAIYHPVGIAMLSNYAQGRMRLFGWNGVFGNFGIAVAALVTGAIVATLGWRAAFILPGLVSIGVGLLYLALIPDERLARRAAGGPRVGADVSYATARRVFFIVLFASIAGGVVFNGGIVSLPKLFEERLPAFAQTAMGVGLIASLVYMAGGVAQVIVGRALEKHSLAAVFLFLAALQGPALLAASFATNWSLLFASALIMVSIFGQATVNDAMVARFTNDEWRGRVFALRYFVSLTASAGAIPLVAYLHLAGGFTLSYQIMAASGLLVLLCALAFWRTVAVAPRPSAAPAE